MLRLFLDTNQIIRNEYFLDSNLCSLFKTYVKKKKDDVVLYVPQIVIEETCKHFRQEMAESPFGLRTIQKLIADQNINLTWLGKWYSDYLRAELVALGGVIIGYPSIAHEEIVHRYVLGRKPFAKKKGDARGYKDSLLWHSLLQVAKEDKEISENQYVLITDDKDFCSREGDGEYVLHGDLQSEIDELGVGHLEIMGNLKQFRAKYIDPVIIDIDGENRLREFLGSNESLLREKLNEDVHIDHLRMGLMYVHDVIPTEFEDCEVVHADVKEVRQLDKYDLEDGKAILKAQIVLELDAEILVFKGDDYLLDDYDWQVWEYDWDDGYTWGALRLSLSVDISIAYDDSSKAFRADTFEIEDLVRIH